MLTWAQLGFHQKPCGFLNVAGYYDKLIEFIDSSVQQKFVKDTHRKMILVDNDPQLLIDKLKNYKAPFTDRLIALKEKL